MECAIVSFASMGWPRPTQGSPCVEELAVQKKTSVWGALMRVINNRVEFWVLKVIMIEMKVER